MNKLKHPKTKIMFIDIETSPNIGLFWKCGYDISITPENIIKEKHIICVSWTWNQEKKVHHLSFNLSKQDDKQLLTRLVKVINKADIIVGYNSNSFDLPWINGRLAKHNLPPCNTIQTIDLYRQIRKSMHLNSNKLAYVTEFFGIESKNPMTFSDWKEIILNKSRKSLDKMLKYCDKDVDITRKVFYKVKRYLKLPVHFGAIEGADKDSCINCGSKERLKQGTKISSAGLRYQIYQCKKCGKKYKGGLIK